MLDSPRPTGVGSEASPPASSEQFDVVILRLGVVEIGDGVSLAELPDVKQVLGALVVDAGADLQAWTVCSRRGGPGGTAAGRRRTLRQQLLHEARVDDMRT